MTNTASKPPSRLVRKRLSEISPSPENDEIYRPICYDDPAIADLAQSINKNGLLEPLVVTQDGFILSGHRRFAACKRAGLNEALCQVENFCREDAPDKFRELLREYNRQRAKSVDEKFREAVIDCDPEQCHERLITQRAEKSRVGLPQISLGKYRGRSEISDVKRPMLDRVIAILEERRKFWPISLRAVHYALLNHPVLRNTRRPKSIYQNQTADYNDLSDLTTRARLTGEITMEAIEDDTRPIDTWEVYDDPSIFIDKQLEGLLTGYYRNYMRSQPSHIELLVEKLSIAPIIREIAAKYCIPMTIGRGYASLPPRVAMANRYFKNGKEKFVLLILSDFDPDGEMIAESYARSMRDDFGIQNIHPVKVALTCTKPDLQTASVCSSTPLSISIR